MVAIPRRPKPERTDEAAIQFAIRERLGKEPDLFLMRNALAQGERWDPNTGKTSRFMGGLGTGSADLVGMLTRRLARIVRPGIVSEIEFGDVAVFIAFEVKAAKGRIRPEQVAWMKLVRSKGGAAFVVRSVDDALAALDRARNGETE